MCGDIAKCKVPSSTYSSDLELPGTDKIGCCTSAIGHPYITGVVAIAKRKIVAHSHGSSSRVVVYTSKAACSIAAASFAIFIFSQLQSKYWQTRDAKTFLTSLFAPSQSK